MGIISEITIGLTKGDTRSLDYSSCGAWCLVLPRDLILRTHLRYELRYHPFIFQLTFHLVLGSSLGSPKSH